MWLRFLSYWPLGLLYAVAWLLAVLLYGVFRYRRALVDQNLRRAFPELDNQARRALAWRFYRGLTEAAAETMKANRLTPQQVQKRVQLLGDTDLRQQVCNGQPVVLLLAHHRNWGWALLALAERLGVPIDLVYKPQRHAGLNGPQGMLNSRYDFRPIAVTEVLPTLFKRHADQHALVLIADQRPRREEAHHWVDFLGNDTPFFVGPEKIARLFKWPVYFVGVERQRQGYYQVRIQALGAPPYPAEGYPITEAYAQAVAQQVKADPAGWLWSHQRWKMRRQYADRR